MHLDPIFSKLYYISKISDIPVFIALKQRQAREENTHTFAVNDIIWPDNESAWLVFPWLTFYHTSIPGRMR